MDSFDIISAVGSRGIAIKSIPHHLPNIKIPHTETTITKMLNGISETLDLSMTHFVNEHNIENSFIFNSDPWKLKQIDTNIPCQYRSLGQRVRTGDKEVKWTAPTGDQYAVVHIKNEDRIIPVKHHGGSYHEISWKDGTVIRKAKLIQYDSASKTYHSNLGLLGGSGKDGIPSGDQHIGGSRLRDRPVVEEIASILKTSTNTDINPIIEEELFKKFSPIISNPEAASFAPHTFYRDIYERSPTFRRIANHFLEMIRATKHTLEGSKNKEKLKENLNLHKEIWGIKISDDISRPYVTHDIAKMGEKLLAYLLKKYCAITIFRNSKSAYF